ncbi:MAG: LysR family transcriptional regulator [Beijerinckiaceae bacterium]
MDITTLRYALRASDHLSFRAAARSFGIGQGSLSRRIRSLEDEIGVSLFERHRSGVRATAAGRQFLARVRSALDELDYAVERASTAGRAETGLLRIGVFHSLTSGRLRDIVIDYRLHWPDVSLEFTESDSEAQMTALRERQIDVGFIVGADQVLGLEHEAVWSEPAFIALAERHTLASHDEVAWADLLRQRIIMRTRGDGSSALSWLAERRGPDGTFADVTTFAVSRETLLALVGAGFGSTVVAESATTIHVPGVVFRRIKVPDIFIPFRMVWFAGNDNPALRRFLSHVRTHIAAPKRRP